MRLPDEPGVKLIGRILADDFRTFLLNPTIVEDEGPATLRTMKMARPKKSVYHLIDEVPAEILERAAED